MPETVPAPKRMHSTKPSGQGVKLLGFLDTFVRVNVKCSTIESPKHGYGHMLCFLAQMDDRAENRASLLVSLLGTLLHSTVQSGFSSARNQIALTHRPVLRIVSVRGAASTILPLCCIPG